MVSEVFFKAEFENDVTIERLVISVKMEISRACPVAFLTDKNFKSKLRVLNAELEFLFRIEISWSFLILKLVGLSKAIFSLVNRFSTENLIWIFNQQNRH